jgi:hypothetical protein
MVGHLVGQQWHFDGSLLMADEKMSFALMAA